MVSSPISRNARGGMLGASGGLLLFSTVLAAGRSKVQLINESELPSAEGQTAALAPSSDIKNPVKAA